VPFLWTPEVIVEVAPLFLDFLGLSKSRDEFPYIWLLRGPKLVLPPASHVVDLIQRLIVGQEAICSAHVLCPSLRQAQLAMRVEHSVHIAGILFTFDDL